MKKITIISICGAFVLLLGILAGKLALDVSNDGLLDQNVEALAGEDVNRPENGWLAEHARETVYDPYLFKFYDCCIPTAFTGCDYREVGCLSLTPFL